MLIMTTAYASPITQQVYSAIFAKAELADLLAQYGDTKFTVGRLTEIGAELIGNLQVPRIEIATEEVEKTPEETVVKLKIQVVINDPEVTQDGILETYAGEQSVEQLAAYIISAIEGIEGIGQDLTRFGYAIDGSEFPLWSVLITLDFSITRGLDYDPDIST
jgi:hypothetical protein